METRFIVLNTGQPGQTCRDIQQCQEDTNNFRSLSLEIMGLPGKVDFKRFYCPQFTPLILGRGTGGLDWPLRRSADTTMVIERIAILEEVAPILCYSRG